MLHAQQNGGLAADERMPDERGDLRRGEGAEAVEPRLR